MMMQNPMKKKNPTQKRIRRTLQTASTRFRHSLGHVDALPQLTLLSIFTGLATSIAIIAFQHLVELPLSQLLPQHVEDFEGLPPWARATLTAVCTLLLMLLFLGTDRRFHSVGVPHVIERLAFHQGLMPYQNAVLQFFGGALSAIGGLSVGREGPAIHLGAACSSLLGQWLTFPNNCIRTLVGCGAAAAISVSFNTPIAGVIFAIEVVISDYRLNSFIPVILAAVCGATLSHMVYGDYPAFTVPALDLKSDMEMPAIIFLGLVCGTIAAGFIRALGICQSFLPNRRNIRFICVAFATGIIAMFLPQVMGIGYDSVNAMLKGELDLSLLMGLLIFKLLLTAFTLGCGIPGGVIGPSLFLGACTGGVIGTVANTWLPGDFSSSGLYAMLGMGAMMGAVLQAPLSALMALLELTHNPYILFPGMLAIVVACLTSSLVFRCQSVFISSLASKGLKLHENTLSHTLHRAGVTSLMDRSFKHIRHHTISAQLADILLKDKPKWIIIDDDPKVILRAADLARFLHPESLSNPDNVSEIANDQASLAPDTPVDLIDIPAQRFELGTVMEQASLKEAWDLMEAQNREAVAICRKNSPLSYPVIGILTKQAIDDYYRIH